MTQPSASASPRHDLLPGTGGAVAGAVLGAAAWAVLVSVSNYKIGFAAIGVGALTGFLAGRFGGPSPSLPWVAAAIGLVGCLLGDLLADAHQVSVAVSEDQVSVSMLRVFREMLTHPSFGWEVYKAGFAGLDVLFYALAARAAWQLASVHRRPAPTAAPATAPTFDTAPVEGSPFDPKPPSRALPRRSRPTSAGGTAVCLPGACRRSGRSRSTAGSSSRTTPRAPRRRTAGRADRCARAR